MDETKIVEEANPNNAVITEFDFCGIEDRYSNNNQSKVLEVYLH